MADRKYSHRGYQDGGGFGERERTERPRPQGPQGPRPEREGPRGRGLGAPTLTVFRCRQCGQRLELQAAMAEDVVCAKCGSDLHACANCIHFDTSATHACRKPVPTPVGNKTKRNACELFAPRTVQEFAPEAAAPKAYDPRAAFDALFKK